MSSNASSKMKSNAMSNTFIHTTYNREKDKYMYMDLCRLCV